MCVPIGGMRWTMTARKQSGFVHVCLFKQKSDRETYIISFNDCQIQVPLFMWSCPGFSTHWEWPEQGLFLLRLVFKLMACRGHGEKITGLKVHTWIDILVLHALALQLGTKIVSYSSVVGGKACPANLTVWSKASKVSYWKVLGPLLSTWCK